MFQLVTDLSPKGDQPKAIERLVAGINKGYKEQTLLGVTGSGKTFTIANVISRVNRPTLVISHNKTLAAQLYNEFREFFPNNRVEYFVSFYDYYQPEAYIPQTDTYIEKDSSINQEIDRLRLSTTRSLLTSTDVIVVASVSCIYGIGAPKNYRELVLLLEKGKVMEREDILRRLIELQYERSDYDFYRGRFRVRGDVIEIFPAYEERPIRVELFGDEIERIRGFDHTTGEVLLELDRVVIYPARHFVTTTPRIEHALLTIEEELKERLIELRSKGKLLEAQRLESRTRYDMELMRETGYCPGIENYSRHLDGRLPGERPGVLLDYFPEHYLMVIDESHVTIPQLQGMYEGNLSRKRSLIEHGFRLPSAYDHRPLKFSEFQRLMPQTIYVSATPSPFEIRRSRQVVEQIIRPTGLVDPVIRVKETTSQIDDLIHRINSRVKKKERVLVTTLTKRMAEDLADYLYEKGINVKYLHSEINTLERVEILRDLRLGEFDVLVGVNLLREGLDLPEVSLVAILDADKEGFLRSERSLIQVIGRTARNISGEVIMYADDVTHSMKRAIEETERRRKIQLAYNERHHITPKGIKKEVKEALVSHPHLREKKVGYKVEGDLREMILELEHEMKRAADALEFEKAASLRDEIIKLRSQESNESKHK
ncbi:MAG: excinuclease ABC subunit UvrB [bacterium]|nr:excinuclease ABC subunit UvrB [bacterium]